MTVEEVGLVAKDRGACQRSQTGRRIRLDWHIVLGKMSFRDEPFPGDAEAFAVR